MGGLSVERAHRSTFLDVRPAANPLPPLRGKVPSEARRMRGIERSEMAPYVQHAKFAIKRLMMPPEVPRSLLLRFAREQRANAVQAEAIIWRAVRNRRCEGAKFQRQVPLGQYILDFVCFGCRLIVEIDGPSREIAEQRIADQERDGWLREQGFQVLRLPNELVIALTELAVARIRDALAK